MLNPNQYLKSKWLTKSEERETVLYETFLSKIKSSIILLLSNIWQFSHVSSERRNLFILSSLRDNLHNDDLLIELDWFTLFKQVSS